MWSLVLWWICVDLSEKHAACNFRVNKFFYPYKNEATNFSEILIFVYQTTRHQMPQYRNLNTVSSCMLQITEQAEIVQYKAVGLRERDLGWIILNFVRRYAVGEVRIKENGSTGNKWICTGQVWAYCRLMCLKWRTLYFCFAQSDTRN